MNVKHAIGGIVRMVSPEDEVAEKRQEVRDDRIAAARRNTKFWTEVDETALVRREMWLVHADTDQLYTRFFAPVFAAASANVIANYNVALVFMVTDDGVVFLEASTTPSTGSDVVRHREMRKGRAGR